MGIEQRKLQVHEQAIGQKLAQFYELTVTFSQKGKRNTQIFFHTLSWSQEENPTISCWHLAEFKAALQLHYCEQSTCSLGTAVHTLLIAKAQAVTSGSVSYLQLEACSVIPYAKRSGWAKSVTSGNFFTLDMPMTTTFHCFCLLNH